MTTKQQRSNYSKIWWSQIQPSFQQTSFLQRIARRRALSLSLAPPALHLLLPKRASRASARLVLCFLFSFLSFFLVFGSVVFVYTFSGFFFRIIFFVSSSFLLGVGHKLVVVIPPYLQISSPLVLVWCS
jgi:hypothetical protein